MNWVRISIIVSAFLMCHSAGADSSYLINFGDDLWSTDLLSETCPNKLGRALEEVIESLSKPDEQVIAVLPDELGYQYFLVEFKKVNEDGELESFKSPVVYQFQYWTYRDEHERCLKVEPYNVASVRTASAFF